jgi:hypothetical protein
LIQRVMCRLIIALFGITACGFSQAITTWYIVDAPSPDAARCLPLASAAQLETALAGLGWSKGSKLPTLDWTKKIALLTSSDQYSQPDRSAPSQDGSKVLIAFRRTDRRNSGVFLLEITGTLGSSNSCGIYLPPTTASSVTTIRSRSATTSKK